MAYESLIAECDDDSSTLERATDEENLRDVIVCCNKINCEHSRIKNSTHLNASRRLRLEISDAKNNNKKNRKTNSPGAEIGSSGLKSTTCDAVTQDEADEVMANTLAMNIEYSGGNLETESANNEGTSNPAFLDAVESANPRSSETETNIERTSNDSHIGEQTPHIRNRDFVANMRDVIQAKKSTRLRAVCAMSPEHSYVRNMPLPSLSWCDSKELSTLMYNKEEYSSAQRKPDVFRKIPDLNTRMRAILFDWLMEVCDVYNLRRVTYYLAIDFIERVLSKKHDITKQHLQLLGITCLFIAAKLEEVYPPKLSELAYVTDGACAEAEMLKQEIEVLTALKWDVNPITITEWLCIYLQLDRTQSNGIRQSDERWIDLVNDDIIFPQFSPYLYTVASMIIDLCSLDDGMMQFSYSVIAASVAYYVLSRERALFVSTYSWNQIKTCVEWMLPFAEISSRSLSRVSMPTLRESIRNGSALRKSNPKIVLEDAHSLQTHVIDLNMLETVYQEIRNMRDEWRILRKGSATGWTLTNDGFDSKVSKCTSPKKSSNELLERPIEEHVNEPVDGSASDEIVTIFSESNESDFRLHLTGSSNEAQEFNECANVFGNFAADASRDSSNQLADGELEANGAEAAISTPASNQEPNETTTISATESKAQSLPFLEENVAEESETKSSDTEKTLTTTSKCASTTDNFPELSNFEENKPKNASGDKSKKKLSHGVNSIEKFETQSTVSVGKGKTAFKKRNFLKLAYFEEKKRKKTLRNKTNRRPCKKNLEKAKKKSAGTKRKRAVASESLSFKKHSKNNFYCEENSSDDMPDKKRFCGSPENKAS